MERRLSYSNYQKLLSEVEGSIYKILEQFSWEEDKEFHEVEDMLDNLNLKEDIHNKYQYLKEIIQYICKLVDKHKNTYYEILKDRILRFTRENYQNEDFSLSMIAREFDLTEVYISHLFKEYVGDNFSSYLEDLRMKRACRLLIDTDYNIKDIAHKSGYSSYTSFSRAFKRNKGMSASQFRRCN